MIMNHTFVLGQSQGSTPTSKIFYLTCHLKRAIHAGISRNLKAAFMRKMRTASMETDAERKTHKQFRLKKIYLHKLENLLHSRQAGPHYLEDIQLATIVEERIHDLDGLHYNLLSYSIMPNHFHILIEIEISECLELENSCCIGGNSDLRKLLELITAGTTKPINAALRRVGPVWESICYGMQIKDQMTLKNITKYISKDASRAYEPALPTGYEFKYVKDLGKEEKVNQSVG